MSFFKGFLLGLSFIVFIGPVLFTLLKSTLQYGLKSGFAVALGIFMSDVLAVLLCAFGAAAFFKDFDNQFYIAIIGGIILLALGFKYIFKPNLQIANKLKLKKRHYFNFFAKGFFINFINPFVFLVWIGVIGFASGVYGWGSSLLMYLIGTLLAILLTDTLKVLFAHRLKKLLQPQMLRPIYQAIGVLLVLFGLRLFYEAWKLLA